ncbi:MAG: shikimate dehydrogenase, partial [Betaproteobacteria bacterium]
MTAPDLYAVIGHPVEHSQSPFIHARFAALTGQSMRYERRLAPLGGFAATLAAFAAEGGRGCNVTVPFKHEAFRLAGRSSERARRAGAANVLSREGDGWAADNSDGIGLVRDLRQNAGAAIADRRLLLVGAGGAAAGVLGPLIEERPAAIVVANR